MTVVSISKSAPVTANASGVVNGSPELVWTVLTDLMRWPNWNRDVTAMTVEGPISPGTVFRWKSGGMFIVSQLAEVTSPTRIAWTGRTLGISAVHIWELASQDHATRIMTEESFDGVIPRLLPGMMRRMLKKALERVIQMLVAECERQARSKL